MKKIYVCTRYLDDLASGVSDSSQFQSHVFPDEPEGMCPLCSMLDFGSIVDVTMIPGENGEYVIQTTKGNFSVNNIESTATKRKDSFEDWLAKGVSELVKVNEQNALRLLSDEEYEAAIEELEISISCAETGMQNFTEAQKYDDNKQIRKNLKEAHVLLTNLKKYLSQARKEVDGRISSAAGLSIIIMDCSESMSDPVLFANNKKPSKLNRSDMVIVAVTNAIWSMKDLYTGLRQSAFLYVILFAQNVKQLLKCSIDDIFNEFSTKEEFRDFLKREMINKEELGLVTDINQALEMAHGLVLDFINNRDEHIQSVYKSEVYPINEQSIAFNEGMPEEFTKMIPNVRVFLYSDGSQFTNGIKGKVNNPFKITLNNELEIDPLMTAYIGGNTDYDKEGMTNLRSSSSKCPIHQTKQFFRIDLSNANPSNSFALQNIFTMATGNSGFCPKCMADMINRRSNKKIVSIELDEKQMADLSQSDYRPGVN